MISASLGAFAISLGNFQAVFGISKKLGLFAELFARSPATTIQARPANQCGMTERHSKQQNFCGNGERRRIRLSRGEMQGYRVVRCPTTATFLASNDERVEF
jgi:hypothetical protein